MLTALRSIRYQWREARKAVRWDGTGEAPHTIKQGLIRRYARTHGLRILVETGTLYGEMVNAMRDDFERIYSIELSAALAARARRRFKRYPHITIIHGDSGMALADLVPRIGPALFWLDGHYSGGETAKGLTDTPIRKELAHIIASPHPHIVLVDDARLFGRDPAYPTIADVEAVAGRVRVESDAIVIEHQGLMTSTM